MIDLYFASAVVLAVLPLDFNKMSDSLTREEAREEARLNRHLNADPTTAKCIGGLRPLNAPEPEEHNVRVSDPDDPDATLSREEERLARHVAASKARAKEGAAPAPKPKVEEPSYKCEICGKTGDGQFCMIEMKRNPRATVHVDCFACSKCGTLLAGGEYCEDAKGNLLCEDCMKPAGEEKKEEEEPRVGNELCAKCKGPFIGTQSKIRAIGNVYHEKCFACDACGGPIRSSCYKGEGGKLYCSEPCARRGYEQSKPPASKEEEEKKADAASQNPDDYQICSACGKELDDDFIVLAGKPLHRDCFVCSGCGKKLTNQVFNVDGKMCCKECAEKAQ